MTRSQRAALGVLLVANASLAGCSATVPTAASPVSTQPAGSLQTLRVTNTGSRGIDGLIVIFPDKRVGFGDLAAGDTTTYHAVGRGVFRYAAYEHRVGASTVTQPVIDWVGEMPMPGQAFTYSIEAFENAAGGVTISLVSTARDR